MEMQNKVNSNLGKVKVMVCHTGKNLNNSKFTKEALEKALYSLEGIPLVGEYKEDNEDFGGHGGKIELSDEGFKWIETTKPYGFIPMGDLANIHFEMIMDKDGLTEREWLIADAYVWYKRYPEVEKLFDGDNNQSMEISVLDYEYDEEDNYCLDIKGLNFEACCILGVDVDPAMKGAKIKGYSTFEEFTKEFKFMMQESIVELQEINKDETPPPQEPESDNEFEKNEKETKALEEYELLERAYEILKTEYEAKEVKIAEISKQNIELSTEKEVLETTIKTYEDSQKEEDLEELYSQFEELTEEELTEIKENSKNMSIEEIENTLFAMVGKKQKQFAASKSIKKTAKIVIPTEPKSDNVPYGGLIEKYKN